MPILVTGGAGYIGSHTVIQLIECGYEVIILDNLCNSNVRVVERIEEITNQKVTFIKGDIRDKDCLASIFSEHEIQLVIHFAGLKAVGESVTSPLTYYLNNVYGTLVLCECMNQAGVKSIIFSSSATVYGEDALVPYTENMPRGNTSNPYGTSKAMVEQVLTDLSVSDSAWSVVLLRYFNPIGAHPSGCIGEDPKGIPNNLMPFISQVAIGKREQLSIFGNDYPTRDGTCERDYLHVMDLANGHVSAIQSLKTAGVKVYNLGTGKALSVLEMVKAFESVTGVEINHNFAPRREGDLAAFWADASKAKDELGWVAERTLNQMIEDTWRWQTANPNGFD